MTSIRKQVADAIQAESAALDVHAFGIAPEELRRPAVAVFREKVAQGASLDLGHSFVIQVMAPQGFATEATEDALDGYLDTVLQALARLPTVAFTDAERKVFLEKFQGWEVQASWASRDYYAANA